MSGYLESDPSYDREERIIQCEERNRVEPEYRYRIVFERATHSLARSVVVKWGYDEAFCRALAAMISARLLLRGIKSEVGHYTGQRVSRAYALEIDLWSRVTPKRIVNETRAAIRECKRISAHNRETLWGAG